MLTQQNTVRYEHDPGLLRAQVMARPKSDWIVVDEVQRVPKLLDEAHYLMEEEGYKRFALTGSSARRLRRGGVLACAEATDSFPTPTPHPKRP